MMPGIGYIETRPPTSYVLIAGPSAKLPSGGVEYFGPFESEDNATLWATAQLPERVLFQIVPLFANVYP